jgi:hypothetical protein
MKKILIALFILGMASNVQGANIIGATNGVTKFTVEGFGEGDSAVANSKVGAGQTTAVITDVGTPVDSVTEGNTDGLVVGFIHDYVFQTVQDTFASIHSAVQLSGSTVGSFITPLVLQVFRLDGHVLPLPVVDDTVMGTVAVASDGNGTTRSARLNILFEAGQSYVIRMTNASPNASLGTDPNYTLKVVSAVPVPAAVWLFGTALLGLFGFKRKSQAAGAVAA